MQFDIHGDSIIYQGHVIGTLYNGPWIGLRIEVEDLLKSLPDLDLMMTEDECAKAVQDAREEAEEVTKDELNEKHEKDLERATEEGREAGHEAGFREGRTDALEAAGKAADVFRVDALLAALEAAEKALWGAISGTVGTDGRRHPAKIGETKEAVRRVIFSIASTRAEYERG